MIRRFIRSAFAALSIVALAAAAVSLLPERFWPFEILASFRVQVLSLTLVAGASALLLRLRVWAVLGLGTAFLQILLSIPLFVAAGGPEGPSRDPAHLCVLSMNVEWSNREGDEVLSLIRSLDPDVVALQEVDYWWRRKLEALRDLYPYQTYDRGSTRPGVAVLARTAPSDETWFPLHGRGAVILRFGEGEDSFRIATAHAFPPKTPRLYRLRNGQLDELAAGIDGGTTPLLLAGDLNTTPWSPVLREFEGRTRLRSARIGRGALPTWPSWNLLLGVPIDHVYHSEEFRVEELERIAVPGSDHLGLLARVSRATRTG
jgi:endonuclease/exonuclease/phosphatase (EEP) superfamily protein YafD